MIQNACKYSSPLKKKHLAICYHRCREAIAAGIVDVGHIDTGMNLADICTKALAGQTLTGWLTLSYHAYQKLRGSWTPII